MRLSIPFHSFAQRGDEPHNQLAAAVKFMGTHVARACVAKSDRQETSFCTPPHLRR